MRDIEDMDEVVYSEDVSDCCGASIYTETDICSDCNEHCGVQDDD